MGKSDRTPSISFTGVLNMQGPKISDSSDVVSREQVEQPPHSPVYAGLLSVRLHPHKNQSIVVNAVCRTVDEPSK